MGITHTKVSAISDGGDATLVRPSDWNASHVIELDYVEGSDTSITATSEGAATTIITSSSLSYDGSTPVIIEYFTPELQLSVTTTTALILALFEDGSSIGWIEVYLLSATLQQRQSAIFRRRLTPSSGSHTYSIRGWLTASGAAASSGGGAGGSGNRMPAYIRITKV